MSRIQDARQPDLPDMADTPGLTPAAPMAASTRGGAPADLDARIGDIDWTAAAGELDERGHAILPGLLPAEVCAAIAAMYPDQQGFRSEVIMQRHGFGQGRYKYFAYPLPAAVATLREALYPHLAPIANRWHEALRLPGAFPARHADFIARCHAAGQTRPTPLLIQYGPGDYNCLHQDLYGEHVFPIQAVALLSEPGRDFSGGELVLTEQRPRMQSRVEVLPLRQGDVALFAVQHRPVGGARGVYRVTMRHGVSRIRSGSRHTLGIIFHDAA